MKERRGDEVKEMVELLSSLVSKEKKEGAKVPSAGVRWTTPTRSQRSTPPCPHYKSTPLRVAGPDDGVHAAPRPELSRDLHLLRTAGGDKIIEDPVHRFLVEDAPLPVGEEVILEGLELEAPSVGNVRDRDGAEIGKAGAGAHRGILGVYDGDAIVPAGELVFEGLDGRFPSLRSGFSHRKPLLPDLFISPA